MIGIDTNVIVRYIVQDDPEQAKVAAKLIEQACSKDNPGYINHIVLCEIVWVLRRNYKLDKQNICRVIEQIMRTDKLLIEDIQLVWKALEAFKETKADFADCLLGQRNLHAGCQYTATLDDAASVTKGYKHLLPKSKS
ncbi:MAG: type II toxin-antitoxin system VapC family toxin [Desulfobacteraceae bacterium]|jgi:predicted nucleic-acid-binding protein